LKKAIVDLAQTRSEAAKFGRSVWHDTIGTALAPADDASLLRQLFERIGADRDRDANEALAHWREHVNAINALVHDKSKSCRPAAVARVG
jgi:hypothetical protein